MVLRVISDVHGNTDQYLDIIKDVDYSVQLGDFNFNYDFLKDVDPTRHVFISGNHDAMHLVDNCPNWLGHFGEVELGPWNFFFVRGAYSIDEDWRRKYELIYGKKILWEDEQLSAEQMEKCLQLYKKVCPTVVLSHTCPSFVAKDLGFAGALKFFGKSENFTTNTQLLLEYMWNEHQPKLWCVAHFHRNWEQSYGKTHFICRDELEYIDFDEEWNIL